MEAHCEGRVVPKFIMFYSRLGALESRQEPSLCSAKVDCVKLHALGSISSQQNLRGIPHELEMEELDLGL